MNSARKRGEALRQAAYNYTRLFFLTRELAWSSCFAGLLRASCCFASGGNGKGDGLNLPLEEGQFQWRDGVRRDIHGNDMRFGSSDQIRLDQSWRQLTWSQKLAIWTLPVR